MQREENLDSKSVTQDKRELMLEKREQALTERQQQIEEMESKVEATLEKQETELQRISGYTSDQAKQIILERVKKEVTHESALMIKELENHANEEERRVGKENTSNKE